MDIQISQTSARIGVKTSAAKVNVNTQNADLQLHHESASIDIHNEFPKVVISNRECFNTSGLKDIASFMREAVQLAYKAASKFISKVAGDGDSYAAIENGSNPLASIVVRDAFPQRQFAIDSIPKASPQISIEGKTEISAKDTSSGANNGVTGTYSPGRVTYYVVPHNVRIFMLQKPSIDIKYVGKNVDAYK